MAKKKDFFKNIRIACYDNGDKGSFGGTYFLAFLGAAVYYIKHAVTFWGGVVGLIKAMVWPAMLMYKVLELWKM